MKDFKFFKGTLDVIDGDVRATASFNDDTDVGHMYRRRLYHTDRDLYHRFIETIRPTLNQEEVTIRINGGGTGNQIKFYQATRVTTVNPKWWMKVKMFFQTISLYWDQIWGIIVIATIVTVTFGLMIAKVLNVW